jgi:hypothetical protein
MPLVNPITQARIDLDLTIRELSLQAKLSNNTVVYLERGMYGSIPVSLLGVLLPTKPHISSDYREWRKATRIETGEKAPFALEPPFMEFYSHQFFREAILDMSLNGYCAAHCVERKIVFNYEAGNQTRVPKPIQEAISESYGKPFADHLMDQLTPDYLKERSRGA